MTFLDEYENQLRQIILREELFCLKDYSHVIFDDKNALAFLELIDETRLFLNTDGCIDLLTSDLIQSISPAIQFSLANVYLYFPGANNFLNERVRSGNQEYSTYSQTLEDRRFFYYINCTFEKLYNFWDRIGDMLNMGLDLKISERSVYFATVIEKLNETGIKSENYFKLKTFYETDYKDYLNRLRKLIVHYREKQTYFTFEWINSFVEENNYETISKLQKEKNELPGLLKDQLKLSNLGFELAVRLISEIGLYENKPIF